MSTSDDDLRLVERLFAAFERGQIEAVLELISDDFVLVVPPSMSAEPDSYDGPEGVRRYMQGFEGAVDDVRFTAEEFHPEDGCVIVMVRMSGRGAASGLLVDMQAAGIIRVRDGKVTGIETHPDLATARQALGGR